MSEPIKLAQEAFEEIDARAYALRPDAGERAIVVDGSAHSPANRACPHAEFVYEHGTDDDWQAFRDELDELIDAYAHGGYSLGWEDGCLYIYAPGYMPED